jgi:mono/diheme cytochrome c family protein
MTHARTHRPCRNEVHAPIAFALVLALALAACEGGGEQGADPGATTTPAASSTPAASAPPASASPMSEAQLVALGDSVFSGKIPGGICYTCHAMDAKGTQLAPDLTDQQWINSDGSIASIANVVRDGVLQPKQFPAPMPPFGAILTDVQIRGVAAYVYALSHPGA